MAVPEDSAVAHATRTIYALLERARQVKTSTDMEPALPASEFSDDNGLHIPEDISRTHYLAAFEDAARSIYQVRAASTSIDDPDFVEIWNLLDILSHLSNSSQIDPALTWWLIEELLETQSIDSCRLVFDFLESRRELLVTHHFDKKQLVILRAMNELLRRLSRAEEAVFCGRVFVFLFLSFPLGAKSGVNPKGEFHRENVTSFEASAAEDEPATGDEVMTGVETAEGETKAEEEKRPDLSDINVLYPAFWTMQQAFSDPPTYFFKQGRMEEFKTTLEATLKKFREVPKVNQAAADHRGHKQQTSSFDDMLDEETQDGLASTFNPKYLTSRELFSLELSDLAFQRHILVQALILLDFLLSLSEKNKKRIVNLPNKALTYAEYTLPQADADWIVSIRKSIQKYLTDEQLGGQQEGKYYNRMVETVLSRDRNWIRWKLEFCQPIRKDPVPSSDIEEAAKKVRTACLPRRMKANVGMNLRFLDETSAGQDDEMMFTELPNAEALVRDVETVDLDLDFASTEEERRHLEDVKMSKTWRALRLMSKTKLGMFEKVEDGRNLRCFLEEPKRGNEEVEGEENGTKEEGVKGNEEGGDVEMEEKGEAKDGEDGEDEEEKVHEASADDVAKEEVMME